MTTTTRAELTRLGTIVDSLYNIYWNGWNTTDTSLMDGYNNYQSVLDKVQEVFALDNDVLHEAVHHIGHREEDINPIMDFIDHEMRTQDMLNHLAIEWYAVQMNPEDADCGTGSFDYQEAHDMAEEMHAYRIAVVSPWLDMNFNATSDYVEEEIVLDEE